MVRQDDEAAKRLVETELNCTICEPYIGLVVERDSHQIGAVILNGYTPGCNIDLTAVGTGPWNIRDVRDIARYCFSRVKRITARTSVKNSRAIYMLKALGFQREGTMRELFASGDAELFGLLKTEQKIVRS